MPTVLACCWKPVEETPVTAMMQDGVRLFSFSYSRILLVETRPSITGIEMSV